VGHEASEITANDAVPGRALSLIELSRGIGSAGWGSILCLGGVTNCSLDVLRNVLS
jgi:hypothetical protein